MAQTTTHRLQFLLIFLRQITFVNFSLWNTVSDTCNYIVGTVHTGTQHPHSATRVSYSAQRTAQLSDGSNFNFVNIICATSVFLVVCHFGLIHNFACGKTLYCSVETRDFHALRNARRSAHNENTTDDTTTSFSSYISNLFIIMFYCVVFYFIQR